MFKRVIVKPCFLKQFFRVNWFHIHNLLFWVLCTSWTKLILQIIFSWVEYNGKKISFKSRQFFLNYKVGIIGQHFPKIQ
jgi:hypothetical protein